MWKMTFKLEEYVSYKNKINKEKKNKNQYYQDEKNRQIKNTMILIISITITL